MQSPINLLDDFEADEEDKVENRAIQNKIWEKKLRDHNEYGYKFSEEEIAERLSIFNQIEDLDTWGSVEDVYSQLFNIYGVISTDDDNNNDKCLIDFNDIDNELLACLLVTSTDLYFQCQ